MSVSPQALFDLETLFIEKLQEKYKLNLRDLKRAFSRFDLDQNGLLDLRELSSGIQMFLNGVKTSQLQELVAKYDANGDGKISYEEFLGFLQSRTAIDTSEPAESADDYYDNSNNDDDYDAHPPRGQYRGRDEESDTYSRDRGSSRGSDGIRYFNKGSRASSERDYYASEAGDDSFDADAPLPVRHHHHHRHRPQTAESDVSAMDVSNPNDYVQRANVFLSNLRNALVKTATDLRMAGKIPRAREMTMEELQRSVCRDLITKAFQPYTGTGEGRARESSHRVDFGDFCRVLRKYSFPGAPALRTEVLHYLFSLCSEGADGAGQEATGADVDAFIELVYPAGGARAKPRLDPSEESAHNSTSAPHAGERPLAGYELAQPMRLLGKKSRTSLALPQTFDRALVPRSGMLPEEDLVRRHVFGMSTSILSGPCFHVLPTHSLAPTSARPASATRRPLDANVPRVPDARRAGFLDAATIVYPAAALGVVHDLSSNTQRHYEVHSDDITCLALSRCGRYCATGCVGRSAQVVVWETSGAVTCTIQGIERGVNAVEFTHDNKFVIVVAMDENHILGVYSTATAQLVTSLPAHHSISHLSWLASAPVSCHAEWVTREHAGAGYLFATAGEHHMRLWSFNLSAAQSASGAGMLAYKQLTLNSTKTGLKTPKAFTCCLFVRTATHPVACDLLAGTSAGQLHLFRAGALVGSQACIRGGRLTCLAGHPHDDKLAVCAGSRGIVCVVDTRTLAVVHRVHTLGHTAAQSLSTAQQKALARQEAVAALTQRPRSAPRPSSRAAAGKPLDRQTASPFAEAAPAEEPPESAAVSAVQLVSTGRGRDYLLAALGVGRFVRVELTAGGGPADSAPPGGGALPLGGRPGSGIRPGTGGVGAAGAERVRAVFHFHTGPVYALAVSGGVGEGATSEEVSPALPLAATAGDDKQLLVWDLHTHSLLARSRLAHSARCLAMDRTASFLAVGSASGHVCVCFVSDRLAGGGAVYAVQPLAERRDTSSEVSCLAFSPDNRQLAAGGRDGAVYVYDVHLSLDEEVRGGHSVCRGGCVLRLRGRLRGHSSAVRHLDWSRDGVLLRTASADYELLHWDVAAGRRTAAATLADVRWSTHTVPLGPCLAGIWPAYRDGSEINAVHACVAGGRGVVLTANDTGGEVRVLNYPCVVKNAPARIVRGHSSHVLGVRLLGGRRAHTAVTVGGNDGTVMVFDVVLRPPAPRETAGHST